jgi:gamma-glutamylcyclotransferase (GGCT)/AIG2-like uncharacterized protein YtfP
MAKHKVFVYGTLRENPDEPAPWQLLGYKMFAYPNGNFPFPYITKTGKTDDVVYGELLEVSAKQLKELDRYEGIERGLYVREEVSAYGVHHVGVEHNVFVYVERSLHPTAIPSGNWFAR